MPLFNIGTLNNLLCLCWLYQELIPFSTDNKRMGALGCLIRIFVNGNCNCTGIVFVEIEHYLFFIDLSKEDLGQLINNKNLKPILRLLINILYFGIEYVKVCTFFQQMLSHAYGRWFSSVTGVLLKSETKKSDVLVWNCIKHRRHNTLSKTRLLILVDVDNLLPIRSYVG